jgi:hypothetical protein
MEPPSCPRLWKNRAFFFIKVVSLPLAPFCVPKTCVTKFRQQAKAFTLVEVAMALGIFAFAIIPVIGLMGTGLRVSKESIDASTTANIYRLTEAMLSTNAAVTSTVMRALGPRDPRATRNMAVALGALAADACADEMAQAHHLAADAFDARARALSLPVRLSQLPVLVPRESLPLIVQDSLKNFNADPKREFQREVDLLNEVLDAAW